MRRYYLSDILRLAVDLKKHNETETGVYFLLHNDEIVYIGSSTSMRTRVNKHIVNSDMVFNRVLFHKTERHLEEERFYIKEFSPKYNTNGVDKVEKQRRKKERKISTPELTLNKEYKQWFENTDHKGHYPIEETKERLAPKDSYIVKDSVLYANLHNRNYVFNRVDYVVISGTAYDTSGVLGGLKIFTPNV